jgi:hypothetical protein
MIFLKKTITPLVFSSKAMTAAMATNVELALCYNVPWEFATATASLRAPPAIVCASSHCRHRAPHPSHRHGASSCAPTLQHWRHAARACPDLVTTSPAHAPQPRHHTACTLNPLPLTRPVLVVAIARPAHFPTPQHHCHAACACAPTSPPRLLRARPIPARMVHTHAHGLWCSSSV